MALGRDQDRRELTTKQDFQHFARGDGLPDIPGTIKVITKYGEHRHHRIVRVISRSLSLSLSTHKQYEIRIRVMCHRPPKKMMETNKNDAK